MLLQALTKRAIQCLRYLCDIMSHCINIRWKLH